MSDELVTRETIGELLAGLPVARQVEVELSLDDCYSEGVLPPPPGWRPVARAEVHGPAFALFVAVVYDCLRNGTRRAVVHIYDGPWQGGLDALAELGRVAILGEEALGA